MLSRIFDDFFDDKELIKFNHNYNIEQISSNTYAISIVVAGYTKSDIGITFNNGILKVVGRKQHKKKTSNYLYRGITTSKFENNFSLGSRLEVSEANLKNGLLNIILQDNNTEEK